jgi:hypothetical protein
MVRRLHLEVHRSRDIGKVIISFQITTMIRWMGRRIIISLAFQIIMILKANTLT